MEAKYDRTDLDGMTCANCFHYTGKRCLLPGGGHEVTPSDHKCDGHFFRGEDEPTND
jgi:hypothetical protein